MMLMTTRRALWLFILIVTLSGCEQLSPEMQLIHDAADALGGVEAVQGVTALRIEGSGSSYRLGQNRTPDSALPENEVRSYTLEKDLLNHRMRTEIAQTNFAGRLGTAVTGMDKNVAYNVGQDGPQRDRGAGTSRRVLPPPADGAPGGPGRGWGGGDVEWSPAGDGA